MRDLVDSFTAFVTGIMAPGMPLKKRLYRSSSRRNLIQRFPSSGFFPLNPRPIGKRRDHQPDQSDKYADMIAIHGSLTLNIFDVELARCLEATVGSSVGSRPFLTAPVDGSQHTLSWK